MFRVVDFCRKDGKLRLTVETDDSYTPMFLHFLQESQKFTELFRYKLQTASAIEVYQKSYPAKVEQAMKLYAEQLALYRELPGTHRERINVLKQQRISNGEKVTLDGIEAQLRIARAEEKKSRLSRIAALRAQGIKIRDIAKLLEIPVSTVANSLKKLRPGGKSDRSTVAVPDRPKDDSSPNTA